MDESLETILDQLMVAEKIGGRDVNAGPFDLAVTALRNAGLTRRRDATRALGYPHLLCLALEGACQVLTDVDHRRTIAVSVFSEVPPRPRAPRLSQAELFSVAQWCLSYAEAGSASHRRLTGPVWPLLEDCAHGRRLSAATIDTVSSALYQALPINHGEQPYVAGQLALSAFYFALHAARRADQDQPAQPLLGWVARDVGRLEALTEGVGGAVEYCVSLARQLGM